MIKRCTVCGCDRLTAGKVLWPELVQEWRLSPTEAAYADRQQGLRCDACGSNLRAMALASAIMRHAGLDGDAVAFDVFVRTTARTTTAGALAVLDVNGSALSGFLRALPGYERVDYPAVNLEQLPFEEECFHVVVHSDTLEHVARPVRALAECRRVLKTGGACAFTVPIIVGRLSSSREGLPPSYHARDPEEGMRVRTEYGADVWAHVLEAGFAEAHIVSVEYPAGLAIVGVR